MSRVGPRPPRLPRLETKVKRIWQIEEWLLTETAGVTAARLARRCGVNRRTIYRDLDLMSELGIPLYQDGSRFKIQGTYKVPSYRPKLVQE